MAGKMGVIDARAGAKNGWASRRLFPREGGALSKMLTANLVFLVGLVAISFFLPLSESGKWFVLSAATVLGALVERVRAK